MNAWKNNLPRTTMPETQQTTHNAEKNAPKNTGGNTQKNIWGLPAKTMQQITKALAAEPSVKKAIIYGSRAKGTHKAFSDIDIMLNKMPLRDFLALNARLNELPIPYKIDLVLENLIEAPKLQAHIARVGQIFYERKDLP